jgi:photosystem II stability/assembly factor-like uncharacterized protein
MLRKVCSPAIARPAAARQRFIHRVAAVATCLLAIHESAIRTRAEAHGSPAPLTGAPAVSTFTFGGSGLDVPIASAVDAQGYFYVAGTTASTDFPTTPGVVKPTTAGGMCRRDTDVQSPCTDIFVSKLTPDGLTLVYSTYLGDVGDDEPLAIAVDGAGAVYVSGRSWRPTGGCTPLLSPPWCGFIAKLSPAGNAIEYMTPTGGASALVADAGGQLFALVDGEAPSGGETGPRIETIPASGSTLEPFAVLPSAVSPSAWRAMTRDAAGYLYVAGDTAFTDFPATVGAVQQRAHTHRLRRSDDRGNTALGIDVLVGDAVGRVAIDPVTPSRMYVPTSAGLARSTDGGATWTLASPTRLMAPMIDADTPSTAYAEPLDVPGLYRTTDYGSTWTHIDASAQTALYDSHTNTLYRQRFSGVSKSVDGGDTWQETGWGTTARLVAIDSRTPRRLYVMRETSNAPEPAGLFQTSDGGATFRQVAQTSHRFLGFDPAAPSTFYLSREATNELLRTVDDGQSYQPFGQSPGYPSGALSELIVDPTASSHVFVRRGQEWFRTLDGGVTMTRVPALNGGLTFSPSGALFSVEGFSRDGALVKVRPSGEIEYATLLGGSADEIIGSLAAAPDGSVYVAGSSLSPDFPVVHGTADPQGPARYAFLARLQADAGGLIFSRVFSELDFPPAFALGLGGDSDRPYGLTCDRPQFGHEAVCALRRFDARGHVIWTEPAGTGVVAVAVDHQGAAFVAGQTGQLTSDVRVQKFVSPSPASEDDDSDGLLDTWESAFGLNPGSGSGQDGADGDPDGDGHTNAAEFDASTHPLGTSHQYLAEGVVNSFFQTQIAILNPGPGSAIALLRLQGQDAPEQSRRLEIPAGSRTTLTSASLANDVTGPFSTLIESDAPLVVDRTVSWDVDGYGSHAEAAADRASTTWYLAEGSTSGDFALFYLLQNPNPNAVSATVRYLRPFGLPPIDRPLTLPPNSRTTIPVDDEGPDLASTDIAGVVTADQPIFVERAMYRSRPGQAFAAGLDSAGVTAPALSWYLAEGASGPFFDLFVLIANPNAEDAAVTAEYLLLDGQVHTKSYVVPGNGRLTIYVDDEQLPEGSGQRPLANVAVSTTVTSTNDVPIVVERTMWWPGLEVTPDFWTEAHNSPGATQTGTRWGAAEGEVGGAHAVETYLLIANTSTIAGEALITFYFEDGDIATHTVSMLPRSRTNVQVSVAVPAAAGRRFAAVVESLGLEKAQIVVERAMYSNADGVSWAAGTNTKAVRLQ